MRLGERFRREYNPPMHAALAEILRSPEMPSLVDRLQRHRAEEQARRDRFYEEITPEMKAEFINGEVILHFLATRAHVQISGRLARLLGTYAGLHRLGSIGVEKALVTAERNDYEPDVLFYRTEKAAQIHPEQLKLPVPDFAIEILSPSTARRDRGVKFKDYALSGVEEYWLIHPRKQTVERYVLAPSERVFKAVGQEQGRRVDHVLYSAVVSGFQVPAKALFDDEACLEALRAILQSPTPRL